MPPRLLSFVLCCLAASQSADKEEYTRKLAAKRLRTIKQLQDKANKDAKTMCSDYPLAQPISDCLRTSNCFTQDRTFADTENRSLSLAKQEWAKIIDGKREVSQLKLGAMAGVRASAVNAEEDA